MSPGLGSTVRVVPWFPVSTVVLFAPFLTYLESVSLRLSTPSLGLNRPDKYRSGLALSRRGGQLFYPLLVLGGEGEGLRIYLA